MNETLKCTTLSRSLPLIKNDGAAGITDYLTKPISPRALADMLDKWLPKDMEGKKEVIEGNIV